jgi:Lrp/AsnC family leucine-responsive transcriptional regulator
MQKELDPVDIQILQLLQENARMTNKEIGEKLHKTATPINDRVRRLQDMGVIKRYVAVLDHDKIHRGLMAFTHVQLKDHSKDILGNFERQIIQSPEVLECYHLSGAADFLLKVAVRDLKAYHEFLMNRLFNIMAVGSVESKFVFKEAKSENAFPLEALIGPA